MATATIEKTLLLKLSHCEAEYLEGLTQNSLSGDEESEDFEIRESIFNAINQELLRSK